jgi:hypothetical protein
MFVCEKSGKMKSGFQLVSIVVTYLVIIIQAAQTAPPNSLIDGGLIDSNNLTNRTF